MLRYYGDHILSMSDESKGAEAYSHLSSIIRDRITPHSGSGLGPKLSALCNNLLKLDHHDIARHIKENAKEREDLQNQLNSLQSSINRVPRNQTIPYQPYYSSTHHAIAFPPHRTQNGHQPIPYATTTTPSTNHNFTTPTPPHIRLASAPPPPIPTSFANSTDSLRLYADAIRTWETQYGKETHPMIGSKYPLTPGPPTPGSNECW
ncbi:hypothetical protein M422DRAFT_54046 [Sphaerobolus stellatus SS14]|uniref:Uncharacterized protein n=1 Tax=Sphaerobolus stellatus (strain SS14) TaxID=990650 RepID=A0A0C9UWJ5_SPHS4|nr:hypothetical protein M422DRAFT_54046 [Sphaerobolus stellatus SS14]